jgi:Predicted hydrocarbon binding protein (contains V4R domain)
MAERQYQFSWEFIGDIATGRPNLGNTTRIEMYRLFQYTLRDVLEERLGTKEADTMLYQAGFLAGKHFCEQFIGNPETDEEFFAKVQQVMEDMHIGILRMEASAPGADGISLSIAEDLDCSGLPDVGHEVCTYDEGFLAGLFQSRTGKPFEVKEIDCWCTGDRTCRFSVKPKSEDADS